MSKPSLAAVAVHAREQDLRRHRAAPPRWAHSTASMPVALRPPCTYDRPTYPSHPRRRFSRRWRPRIAWLPNASAAGGDERGVSPAPPSSPTPCRRPAAIICRMSATLRKPPPTAVRQVQLPRSRGWRGRRWWRGPSLRGRDVEEDHLVGALARRSAAPARSGRPHRAGSRSSRPSPRARPSRPCRGSRVSLSIFVLPSSLTQRRTCRRCAGLSRPVCRSRLSSRAKARFVNPSRQPSSRGARSLTVPKLARYNPHGFPPWRRPRRGAWPRRRRARRRPPTARPRTRRVPR